MGNGDIVVGSIPQVRTRKVAKSKTAISQDLAERLDVEGPAPGPAERRCGAMSQQRSDDGAASTPQKFVHLVGCREPKVVRDAKR